ncbi:MAG: hypothetical protein KGJ09_01885 [Candidatus Omnitrophica bacterium]|nr:hypothetical protein [Candidatus Omnitrophota bacterium]MDE2008808.1 hypothetical protein [Candidatus Omnitrophota bacterium]MDE2213629.1 hypothetical protein [Candidatus Omnitrophota bacterium]MDE2230470.1 hypothetical protein [Candidatus Omnitrophota bacterium]
MKTFKPFPLPLHVSGVFLFSLIYWIFLSLKSISADLIGYKTLGSIIYHQGLVGYAATGLQREPLYPLLCSLAMYVEHLSGVNFTHIMAALSIIMLMISQILIYAILRKLNIRPLICSLVLLYWAVSPCITESAFHILLFCEIVTYPLILAVIIFSYLGWESVKENDKGEACAYGALTGLLFALLTLVKAAFECICPAYLIFFFLGALHKNKFSASLICFLAAAGLLFYSPIVGYKSLNKMYNGHFAVTNRGDWAFYGVAAHRVRPLKNYLINLDFVIGNCEAFFQSSACNSVSSGISDSLGTQKAAELAAKHIPPQAVSNTLLQLSIQKILSHPFQYILLSATEGLKALFWENNAGIIPLRFIMPIITFFAIIYCCFNFAQAPILIKNIMAMIFLFVFFYSFFDTLGRYFLPISSLYLISIGYCMNSLCNFLSPSKNTIV